ncbi:GmrSD restriction endonuclease domain-containing protein [Deinococcus sp. UYEF24]
MKITDILSQVDLNTIALPEFQRGYVWNREQVKGLMVSLYRGYPVGGLLTWKTRSDEAVTRGGSTPSLGTVSLLLDGQQRITSLYGVMRGRPPEFFDGNARAFTGLYFNLDSEDFEFYAPTRMQNNPLWVNVSELFTVANRSSALTVQLVQNPDHAAKLTTYITRLGQLTNISTIDFHIDEIVGEDKTIEVVVDIFNRVNSGGTKLSKGDLALAKVCAEWPEARAEMQKALAAWSKAGFTFKLDWFLRVINAVMTGQAYFTALERVTPNQFRQGLADAQKAVNYLLNLVNSYLGLDSDQVLGSRYSFPVMARYLQQRGGKLNNHQESQQLLYWYVHTFLWGRYAGSTESVLASDLSLIAEMDGGMDRLIAALRRSRGDLTVRAGDFESSTRGARFYPLLYMMTRVNHAADWDSGIELRHALLGSLSGLQIHHVFPAAALKKAGRESQAINAIANFTFLTQATNLLISDRLPEEYLPKFEAQHPGVLATHWLPMDPGLWTLERYPDFLAARRELLAEAANSFLNGLIGGQLELPAEETQDGLPTPRTTLQDGEQDLLEDVNTWVQARTLPAGILRHELVSADGQQLAVLDLAWPEGLQEGLSQPVALIIDEPEETLAIASQAGYQLFTDRASFQNYVEHSVLGDAAKFTPF